jgi:hypothetical protein
MCLDIELVEDFQGKDKKTNVPKINLFFTSFPNPSERVLRRFSFE